MFNKDYIGCHWHIPVVVVFLFSNQYQGLRYGSLGKITKMRYFPTSVFNIYPINIIVKKFLFN